MSAGLVAYKLRQAVKDRDLSYARLHGSLIFYLGSKAPAFKPAIDAFFTGKPVTPDLIAQLHRAADWIESNENLFETCARGFVNQALKSPNSPLVGEVIRFKTGLTGIFSHIYETGAQWSRGGSVHIGETGHTSFSGALNPRILFTDLKLSTDTALTRVWTFDKGIAGAGRGIYFPVPSRVWDCTLDDLTDYDYKA